MIDEEHRDKLDRILGSGIFENGAQRENFDVIDLKVELSNLTDEELAIQYEGHILQLLGITDPLVKEMLENYVEALQKDIRAKSPFARLGGEVGKAVHLSMFFVVLKQKGALKYFLEDIMDENTVQSYSKTWLECVKIRTISRNL